MPRVFIVNEPLSSGKPFINFRPAYAYGQEMVHVLPAGEVVGDPATLIGSLRYGLQGFCEDDYLLPVGDPLAIGCAIALAAQVTGGRLNVLRWDRVGRRYNAVAVDIGEVNA